MNQRKTIFVIVIMASLLLQSCSRWLDVKPYDKISEDELFSSEDGFIKLLNGIYIELNSDMLYGESLSVEMVEVMGGAYAIGSDEAVWGNYKDLASYKYNTTYWRARMSETWNKAYSLILNCNMLLKNAEEKKDVFSGNNYKIIKGEATALRAMLHFDMLRLFGPVYSKNPEAESIPYYTAYTTVPEPLLPAEKVAENIISDLKYAKSLLSVDPVIREGVRMDDVPDDGSSKFLYYRNLRLNYYAVTALLARASLYFGDRDSAYDYATDVISVANAGVFPFVKRAQIVGAEDPDKIFSSEVIFSLTHAQRNTLFKDWYDPGRSPNYVFRMDSELYSNLIFGGSQTGGNQDDWRRRANWKATGAISYFYKYSDMADIGNIRNTMIPMIRLGEMYLIAAECAPDGLSYINKLRDNRGVGKLSALTTETLQYEYIRELYGEGQLFYLYKRMYTPVLTSVSANKNPQPSHEIFVVPLPDSETQN